MPNKLWGGVIPTPNHQGFGAMPTLECLDERSRLILDGQERMDKRFTSSFHELRLCIEEQNRLTTKRIDDLQEDIEEIKLKMAEDQGKKSMLMWVGGIALTAFASIFGAIGNAVYSWVIRQS